MLMNILTKLKGIAKLEWIKTLEHKLEELKGISDALWKFLDHWVGTLVAKIDVHGSGSSKTPQPNKRLVVIEEI